MRSAFLEELNRRVLFSDGGMGSLLQEAGLKPGELPETWNIAHADKIADVHRQYLAAGCDILTTNTFGANPFKYRHDGLPFIARCENEQYPLRDVIEAAVKNAKKAADEAGKGFVALDIGPTGKLLQPMGDLAFEDCIGAYAAVVRLGMSAGADLILIETMSDLHELKAAVLAAKENSDLPVVATVAFDASGKLLTGGTPRAVVALLEGLRVDALGLNCGLGPNEMFPMAKALLDVASIPVIVQPNAGLPRSEGAKTVYDLGAEDFAAQMTQILEAGAAIVGGCCGTTPAHIRSLVDACQGRAKAKAHPVRMVSSFADAVVIGDDPVIIGERINPTGKKRFRQALLERDMEYILNFGLEQQEAGAHVLDVNVGVPGVDEPELMEEVVRELQSVTELPLQIDTSDTEAMARAMRVYNGKPLINSVNGKQAVMDAIFPLVQKYGGVVVALCLDEDGIPEDADGRIAIAKKIIAEAAKYDIPKRDLLFDALCMTISSEERGAIVTLETVRRLREELDVGTVLGVSNISFGLPHREIVNAAFYTMALERGLNAAIINPSSDEMMRAHKAFRALRAYDAHCEDYVQSYGAEYLPPLPKEYQGRLDGGAVMSGKDGAKKERESATDLADGATPLYRAISKGLKEQAVVAAKAALTEKDSLTIIDGEMMPALDFVGQGFEKGTLFLPQLIMSAEAAKAAFDVIRQQMSASDGDKESKGRVVLATVKGDIHDIGKNIVKVLLENYNFDVIDLGRDVAPETIVDAAIEKKARLVGLSALMTTTAPAMEETIKQLRAKAPDVKVVVGGAVITQSYADQIGADYYAKDAMSSVSVATEVCG